MIIPLPFYKPDWDLVVSYTDAIGEFVRPYLLSLLGVSEQLSQNAILITKNSDSLKVTATRKVSGGDIPSADLFFFETSPFKLLLISRVFRKDELPSLIQDINYQRPLIIKKLNAIRKNLIRSNDFEFPNNILVVLSEECKYDRNDNSLMIPNNYGAITVIDGQHRLFSYANSEIKTQFENRRLEPKILITALKFNNFIDKKNLQKICARIFIEINTNQTPVDTGLIDAISYDILGKTDSKSIATKIVLDLNEQLKGSCYGLFVCNQTTKGIIKTKTLIEALKPIFDVKKIQKLSKLKDQNLLKRKNGYQNLFTNSRDNNSTSEPAPIEQNISNLCQPDKLVNQGVILLACYFNNVKNKFKEDWPTRTSSNDSALGYTKVFSGFAALLNYFISEGYTWSQVENDLGKIKDNLAKLVNVPSSNKVFLRGNPAIPDDKPSVKEVCQFLIDNISAPTSIQKVIQGK